MKIVEPQATMINPVGLSNTFESSNGIAMLKRVEYFGRVSHGSEGAITEDSYKRFLHFVCMEKGDLSIIEHEHVSVDVLVDRGITHEWVRHRIGSYTQESTRFINYQKKGGEIKLIKPPLEHGGSFEDWQYCMEMCERAYMGMINRGEKPQIARSVFPTGLASRLIATYNLRSWRHFLLMRTTLEAHPQMKQVTIPLLAEFKANIPILFDDIEPNDRQSTAMRKLR